VPLRGPHPREDPVGHVLVLGAPLEHEERVGDCLCSGRALLVLIELAGQPALEPPGADRPRLLVLVHREAGEHDVVPGGLEELDVPGETDQDARLALAPHCRWPARPRAGPLGRLHAVRLLSLLREAALGRVDVLSECQERGIGHDPFERRDEMAEKLLPRPLPVDGDPRARRHQITGGDGDPDEPAVLLGVRRRRGHQHLARGPREGIGPRLGVVGDVVSRGP
jgi:hypothetical protein